MKTTKEEIRRVSEFWQPIQQTTIILKLLDDLEEALAEAQKHHDSVPGHYGRGQEEGRQDGILAALDAVRETRAIHYRNSGPPNLAYEHSLRDCEAAIQKLLEESL